MTTYSVLIEKYTILSEFLRWALEILNEQNDQEIDDRSKIYEAQQKAMAQAQNELDELAKMCYRLLINDENFLREKKILDTTIAKTKEQLAQTESRAEKWIELTEKAFSFAAYARQKFISGEAQEKLELMKTNQNKHKMEALASIRTQLRAQGDLNP